MEVNKKQLADIFGASIRTIQNWQEQGMPVLRGGGKGNEVLYDSAAAIKWYAERDAEIENEKLRREVEELRQASETDLQPGTIEYERHRLTRAQADAQELKNARDSAEVVETAFCTFVLSRIAGEIASILDGIPLSVQRRFPELENRHVDFLKRDIIKAMNKAAALDELIPNFTRGNARADDLVRNNGYAANAIQLHQDHIVGSFFRLSHRPSWRYLGIGEEEARAFSREVEAAWKEFAEDDCCCIDVERKRTFTMMIREGVAMHAFNGELFVQATWDTSPSRLFRTQFRMVSPKRISNPNNTGDSRNCRAGVQINDSGAALGYYVSEDG